MASCRLIAISEILLACQDAYQALPNYHNFLISGHELLCPTYPTCPHSFLQFLSAWYMISAHCQKGSCMLTIVLDDALKEELLLWAYNHAWTIFSAFSNPSNSSICHSPVNHMLPDHPRSWVPPPSKPNEGFPQITSLSAYFQGIGTTFQMLPTCSSPKTSSLPIANGQEGW